jgi:hypothetical protein
MQYWTILKTGSLGSFNLLLYRPPFSIPGPYDQLKRMNKKQIHIKMNIEWNISDTNDFYWEINISFTFVNVIGSLIKKKHAWKRIKYA